MRPKSKQQPDRTDLKQIKINYKTVTNENIENDKFGYSYLLHARSTGEPNPAWCEIKFLRMA